MLMCVSGILLKEYAPEALLICIRRVAGEGKWLRQDLAAKATHSSPDMAVTNLGLLTGRESEIVKLISRRLSNRIVAEQRRTSERTIGIHLHDIHRNLDNANRTMFTALQVLYRATQNGQ
jgi:DNA-binding NarL/FixJ family response regulator